MFFSILILFIVSPVYPRLFPTDPIRSVWRCGREKQPCESKLDCCRSLFCLSGVCQKLTTRNMPAPPGADRLYQSPEQIVRREPAVTLISCKSQFLYCSRDEDCCSGRCWLNRVCLPPIEMPQRCKNQGHQCRSNAECCTRFCGQDGTCHSNRPTPHPIPPRPIPPPVFPPPVIPPRPIPPPVFPPPAIPPRPIPPPVFPPPVIPPHPIPPPVIPEPSIKSCENSGKHCLHDRECCSRNCEEHFCREKGWNRPLPDILCYGTSQRCLVDNHCCSRNCGEENVCLAEPNPDPESSGRGCCDN